MASHQAWGWSGETVSESHFIEAEVAREAICPRLPANKRQKENWNLLDCVLGALARKREASSPTSRSSLSAGEHGSVMYWSEPCLSGVYFSLLWWPGSRLSRTGTMILLPEVVQVPRPLLPCCLPSWCVQVGSRHYTYTLGWGTVREGACPFSLGTSLLYLHLNRHLQLYVYPNPYLHKNLCLCP